MRELLILIKFSVKQMIFFIFLFDLNTWDSSFVQVFFFGGGGGGGVRGIQGDID